MTHRYPKGLQEARQTRAHRVKPRRVHRAREPLQREQACAQRHLHALEHALEELGRPEAIVRCFLPKSKLMLHDRWLTLCRMGIAASN